MKRRFRAGTPKGLRASKGEFESVAWRPGGAVRRALTWRGGAAVPTAAPCC